MFSARIVDIFILECAFRRNLAFELSRKLPFFSPVNAEVHFHKKAANGENCCASPNRLGQLAPKSTLLDLGP